MLKGNRLRDNVKVGGRVIVLAFMGMADDKKYRTEVTAKVFVGKTRKRLLVWE